MEFNISGTYTDLYQLAMGQAYFLHGNHHIPVSFDYFFRKIPFGGGYVVFAGLADILKAIEDFHFTSEDIAYLAEQGFAKEYLEILRRFRFKGKIYAQCEGNLVFPTEPILRIEGRILEVQLIETMVLNFLNFESLIATKASRMRWAAGKKSLSEFGLRRAQGPGAVLAARAAVIGGVDSTSQVYAAQKYHLKCVGTMAHSFVQLYDHELTAFRDFAQANPHHCILLIDTYDTLKSGLPHAVTVAKEMEAQGRRLYGIRLDSGDLSYFARHVRRVLDEADLGYVHIAASNQLDEYVIRSLENQKAPIDIFGIGTSLVTGQPDAALDGVYKMVEAHQKPRIKVSENIHKTTIPGKKQVYRLRQPDGTFFGVDAITQYDEPLPDRLIAPFDARKTLSIKGVSGTPLLHSVMKNGKTTTVEKSVDQLQKQTRERLTLLPEEYKRFENPHIYKVGISPKTHSLREKLRDMHKTS